MMFVRPGASARSSWLWAPLFFVFATALVQAEDDGAAIADLDFFIGEWEGRSTFFHPREEGRALRHEEARAICDYVLKETYIQCDTAWTNDQGRTRTFRLMFNYNGLDGGYQTLFIYDNYPRHVSYLLHRHKDTGDLEGHSTFETSDGRSGEERIVWRVSEDGREIRSEERNHFGDEPEGYWPKYFEFVWRRVN